MGWFWVFKIKIKIKKVSTNNQSNKLPSWFPHVPDILYNRGLVVWEWLKTVSLLKSEFINDIIKPRKLTITKKNCKNVKEIIFLSKMFVFLKFLTEKKTIKKEEQNPKTKE